MPVASVWDDFSDLVTDVVDVGTSVVSVVRGLPGASWVESAVNQGAEWAQDFARTGTGLTVLRAMATAIYGPLAYQIGPWFGPQLATVVWALPGLARGDSFVEAWVAEFSYRAKTTAEIVGGDIASQQFARFEPALKAFKERMLAAFPNLPVEETVARLGFDPTSMARELGLNEYFGVKALQGFGLALDVDVSWFDSMDQDVPPLPTRAQLVAVAAAEKYSTPLAKPLTRAQLVAIAASEAYTPAFKPLTRAQAVALSAAETGSGYARTAPTLDVGGGAPDGPRKAAGDVLLVGVITAAVGALVWFYVGERRGRS